MASDDFVDSYEAYPMYRGQVDYDVHTGDPHLDLERERQYGSSATSQYALPPKVRQFVTHFRQAMADRNVPEIQMLYETGYPKLTEEYFREGSWPDVDDIATIVPEDDVFLLFYRELYFRDIYARVDGGPTLDQRFDSYFNYCSLFNYILNADTPVPLELPNQWLWDIIDEFIYQFQAFTQYRCKVGRKTEDEIDMLRQNSKIWNVHSALNVLHSLVDKSNINKQLEVYTNDGDPDSVAGEFGRHSLYKMLGYFSLVGLLRLHSLLGDYYQAIKVLEHVELNKKSMYSRVPACQITTYYYVGFAYMMMRRYADAIRTFSNILLYIQRTKQMYQTKTYQTDQINKQTEQMYTLLSICLVLHPQRIDESVHSPLREKPHAERMLKMSRGDVQEFETAFMFACPKFLSPVPPSYEGMTSNKEALNLQLKVFMDEIRQQIPDPLVNIPTIRSYLKLYTTMPISKIADFLNLNQEDFRTCLLCFKHKMKNVVWTKGTGLTGEFLSDSEVDFYMDKDMIHIADTKVARRYGDFFIRQIHKFEELHHTLSSLHTLKE